MIVAIVAVAALVVVAILLFQQQMNQTNAALRSIGERISRLDAMLASPKLRGGLGEWTLESLLYEVLPHDHVVRQFRLVQRGVIVDTAVRTGDGRVIAIDSKFPFDAFRRILQAEAVGEDTSRFQAEFARAVRERILEVSSKYISPEDGTLEFALMYVPSESVYYEIAVRDRGAEMLEYARSERVVICSPNTLYAYLQSVMMGIRGMQIAEHVQQVQATLEHLRQDFGEARGRFDRAGDQLRYAVQNIDSARLTLREIEARLERVGQSAATDSG